MVDVVGYLSDGSVPVKFDTDVNAPALAEHLVSGMRVLFRKMSCRKDSPQDGDVTTLCAQCSPCFRLEQPGQDRKIVA